MVAYATVKMFERKKLKRMCLALITGWRNGFDAAGGWFAGQRVRGARGGANSHFPQARRLNVEPYTVTELERSLVAELMRIVVLRCSERVGNVAAVTQ
jgi:hypothetical protein